MELMICWVVFGLIGGLIGALRGRVGSGVVWGVLLGPIGWLITLCLKDLRRTCPHCAETIKPEAKVCPHCQRELTAVSDYQRWREKRDAEKLAKIEDPVDKWAREHPEEAGRSS